jgi:predicted peroxiredoxin
MAGRAVISLATGLEDPERVTVALLVAVGAAEQGRPTLMFLTKEAARLAMEGVATAVACEGCPPLVELVERYAKAGARYMVCPICFDARKLDKGRADRVRAAGRYRPDVAVDRRRRRDHVQLLTARRGQGAGCIINRQSVC